MAGDVAQDTSAQWLAVKGQRPILVLGRAFKIGRRSATTDARADAPVADIPAARAGGAGGVTRRGHLIGDHGEALLITRPGARGDERIEQERSGEVEDGDEREHDKGEGDEDLPEGLPRQLVRTTSDRPRPRPQTIDRHRATLVSPAAARTSRP